VSVEVEEEEEEKEEAHEIQSALQLHAARVGEGVVG